MSTPSSPPAAGPKSKRPSDNEFLQQRLPAWQPILTPRWVVVTFLCVGIPFVILGFVLKAASDGVIELSSAYDGIAAEPALLADCGLPTTAPGSSKTCNITFVVTTTMKAPVYVYYGLDNFYQNHRRYVKSKSDTQLAGQFTTDTAQLSSCDPLITVPGSNPTKIYSPCGLIAQSFFNDTFVLRNQELAMSETGISWKSDRDKKFVGVASQYYGQYNTQVQFLNQSYPGVTPDGFNNPATGSYFDVNNEHFIVWMRPAALPSFRKLYGRIDTDVPAGTTLKFRVFSAFPVAGFQGSKYLVVSTLSWVGGKNPFLGIAYLVVGFACIAMAAFFAARIALGVGRKLGDTSYLIHGSARRGRA